MSKFRIIRRTIYESTDLDDPWDYQYESDPMWVGDGLPTEREQEAAIIEAIVVGPQPIPYDIAPEVAITDYQPVLQKLTKIGRLPVKFVWDDYEPEVEKDEANYGGSEWSAKRPNASQ